VGIRSSAETASWRLREAAEEAKWGAEERILWRGTDAARAAAGRGSKVARAVAGRGSVAARAAHWRAHRATRPLHRLIQTRFAWPLADRLEDYGTATRTAVTTTVVAAALGAAVAGASLAGPDSEQGAAGADTILAATGDSAEPASLLGVTPDFDQVAGAEDAKAAAATPVAAEAVPATPDPPPADAPEPALVAWDFAQAFVRYEVGKADEETAATFAAVAEKPLAEALTDEPPRLPESADVPKAEVLNVVLGPREGKEMEVSVSLLRLEAASELRLTLEQSPKGWRVTEVRG
jgi:hypothetical protein